MKYQDDKLPNIPGYRISARIHESSNSLVYRGVRDKDGLPVVLKVLKQSHPSLEELTNYRQEYDIMAGLADIKGVAGVLSLEKYINTLMICLEDFGGESLRHWINERGMSLAGQLEFAIRAAEILGQIHRRNIIHKDITSDNLVLNRTTGQLKFIDFGIATRLPREQPTLIDPDAPKGSLMYMSPEQTGRMNRTLDYRTDLYSFGVTLYELFTGKRLFESEDPMELVHSHIAVKPVAPCKVNPELPASISNIILKLLEKAAEERYQSAWGIRADLEKCLADLNKSSTPAPFALAQEDIPDRLRIPEKLYGREKETGALLTAFERVAHSGDAQIIMVSGYSGIGKSLLVKEVSHTLAPKIGYFIYGKFDLFQRNIPYSGLVRAFRELVRQLLTEKDAKLSHWREKLLTALGPNGRIIIDVIAEIELIIGPQPEVPSLRPTESENRFNLVFQNFMQVFCRKEHPLVIFLDDLQWADSATLRLLEHAITDQDNIGLLLIGAFRDSEIDPSHPLAKTLNSMHKANIPVNLIHLKPLEHEHVNQLIADSLHQNRETVRPLTDLVIRKTGGNPFFINRFLHTLYDEDLLIFEMNSKGQYGWQWDIDRIKAVNITDNVVELMIGKLKKLPESAQKTLCLAACAGSLFDLETLSAIYKKTAADTFKDLKPAMIEELILPLSKLEINDDVPQSPAMIVRRMRFLHDRVRQAAYAIIPEDQKQTAHQQIGRLMLQNIAPVDRDEKIFDIVNQLNLGIGLIKTDAERSELASLNLTAGKKARSSIAYAPAFEYLKNAISLLEKDCWEKQYQLTLDIHVEAAKAAYLNSQFEQMETIARSVEDKSKTLLDEVIIHNVRIMSYIAQNRLQDVIKICLSMLKQLGVRIPEKPNKFYILLQLLKTKLIVGAKKEKNFIDLPEMTDPVRLASMRLLVRLLSCAYYVTPELLPLVAFHMTNLSIKHGNSAYSSFAYAIYGVILSNVTGEINSGQRFGRIALTLMERFKAGEIEIRTIVAINSGISIFTKHLRQTLKSLQKNYQSALEAGDHEYAALCAHMYCYNSFYAGKEMTALEHEIAQYDTDISRLGQKTYVNYNKIFHQTVLNLLGESDDPCELAGKVYDERIMLPLHEKANDQNAIWTIYNTKMILWYLFGEYSKAFDATELAAKLSKDNMVTAIYFIFHFYDSLIRLANYSYAEKSNLKKTSLKKTLRKVDANQKKIKKWAPHAPMNYLHRWNLVEAERARVLDHYEKAENYYNQAIALASEHEYTNDEALALELAGRFYLENNRPRIAKAYLRDAHYTYQIWGANAKARHLKNEFPLIQDTLIPWHDTKTVSISTSNSALQRMDLNSVIKAAQTMSGEIVLDRLLSKMMRIVIQSAGAQKGYLLLQKQRQWLIYAECDLNKDDVQVLQLVDVVKSGDLCASIVQYVARTQQTVVLDDAVNQGDFSGEAYIRKRGIRSLLCMPLLHKGELNSILYLENNLTARAFTPKRIQLLKALASQAAISLENALLYENLEEKVVERTKQLEKQNVKLEIQAEELRQSRQEAQAANKTKSDFLANMSHEIRTPMNAVIGLTNVVLKSELTVKQRDYLEKVGIASKGLLNVINDILDFSKVEANQLVLECMPFDLGHVMEQLTDLFSNRVADKDLEMIVTVAPHTPGKFFGDAGRLAQILTNLVANAIKFTERGEIVVAVALATGQPVDRTRLEFTVSDTGIGIDPNAIPGLFSPFTQVETHLARQHEGTGLGLAICRKLTELMGGRIWLESTPGKGSKFCFTVNLEQQKAEQAPIPMLADLRGLRALVVDDSATSRQMLVEILESFNFEVSAVDSGPKALTALKQKSATGQTCQLVMLDWKMPGMSGIETAQRIREMRLTAAEHAHQPGFSKPEPLIIIMVTAYGQLLVQEQTGLANVDRLMLKPIKPSAFFDILIELFNQTKAAGPPLVKRAEYNQMLAGRRLLVVEDNALNRDVALALLSEMGAVVELAENGSIGLDKVTGAQQGYYDAVLMDIQMPVMDGYEATGRIRMWESGRQQKAIPIIALTAHALKGEDDKCRSAGMDDFITKPIDDNDLRRVLAKWITPGKKITDRARHDEPGQKPDEDSITLDTQGAIKRLGGRKYIYLNIMREFASEFDGTDKTIGRLMADGDTTGAKRIAHSLKGAASQTGAVALSKAAFEVEKAVADQSNDWQKALAQLKTRLKIALGAISAYLDTEDETKVSGPGDMQEQTSDGQSPEQVLSHLANLLETGDIEAISTWKTAKSLLINCADNQLVAELDQKIERLNFPDALKILRKVEKVETE
ncbi:MAG: AAA family ATPase [Desulfobacteraceae bacterium]|nr:AAA family ATPase [Desulfobacteraceae bacterium]